MSIADKLTLLAASKEMVRLKLGIDEDVPFSEYSDHVGWDGITSDLGQSETTAASQKLVTDEVDKTKDREVLLQDSIESLLKYTNVLEDRLYQLTPFTPYHLFRYNKSMGVWYDPSDKSTLFQDIAGTVPVTKDGDPVALMRDKSGNGNHVTQSVAAARPIYHTDGDLHWLEFDGVDDNLTSNLFNLPQPFSVTLSMITAKANGLMNYFDSLQGGRAVLWSNAGSIGYGLFAGRDAQSGLGVPYKTKDTVTCLYNGAASSVTNLVGKVENLSPGVNALSGIIIGARTGGASGFVPISLYSFIVSEGEHANNTRSFSSNKAGVEIQ